MPIIIYDLDLYRSISFNCSKVEAELRARGINNAKCYLYPIDGKEQVAVEVPLGTSSDQVGECVDMGYA